MSVGLSVSLRRTCTLGELCKCSGYWIRGSGEDGQLGIGNNEEKEWVCAVRALQSENVRSVVAGSRNSLAICEDGKVLSLLLLRPLLSIEVMILLGAYTFSFAPADWIAWYET